MTEINIARTLHRFGYTSRKDNWWIQPLVVFVVLTSFVIYVTWAAFQGKNYFFGPYLSPLYSPELLGDSPHSWFGPKPSWWPGFMPWSPALLILWAPGLFRLTCYYYRGAYYKAMWADPPSCTVSEPRKKYWGENENHGRKYPPAQIRIGKATGQKAKDGGRFYQQVRPSA